MNLQRLILAPMRGFTDVVFRNAFQRHFGGIDEAVAPFITTIKGRRIKPSHLRDLEPAENRSLPVVPQVLGNSSDAFICLAKALLDKGYAEINWNLGCPYPMVAKKMRGSGLLPHAEVIDRLLEEFFKGFSGRISIKTRLGRYSAAESKRLIPVFNRYPLSRVIVHPRTGEQMYAGRIDLDGFDDYLAQITHPIVYNGDITDPDTFYRLKERYPAVSGWMLGRGLLANPFLPEMILGGTPSADDRIIRFKRFHDELVEGYSGRFSGPAHVLDRMKGFWRYFADGYPDGRFILKRVRKADSLAHYQTQVAAFLDGLE